MFKNRIRLPIYLKGAQFPAEANRFRLANGTTKTLSVVIRKTYNLVTDYLPERMHQRLTIALNHDEVNIEGDRYAGGVSVDGEYKIEWPDFLDYPLAQAEVQIQVTPFAATNDNCQTCEEVTQIALEDDTFPDPIEEGGEATINVFDNDSICCSPITAQIVSFDLTYVGTATIDEETGIATITIKDPAPNGTNILLATYRVTCPNGGFDEANIYGDIDGTEPACAIPSGLVYTHVGDNDDQIAVDGTGLPFQWRLYTCDNLGTPIQTGSDTSGPFVFDDLAPGGCYVFSIRRVCSVGVASGWVELEFNVPGVVESCAQFVLTNNGFPDIPTDSCSYMNCEGLITNIVVKTTRMVCMLVGSGNVPVYFNSTNGVTSYLYDGVCADTGPFVIQVSGMVTLNNVTGITHDIAMPIAGGTDVGTWIGFDGAAMGFNLTADNPGSISIYYDSLLIITQPHTGSGLTVVSDLPVPADGVEIRAEIS